MRQILRFVRNVLLGLRFPAIAQLPRLALVGMVLGMAPPPAAFGITINIEYSTDFGGDESPSWDANGAILIAHFQAAKQIWEALLPGSGDITFDFQWDDDIPGLGLATPFVIDDFVEINPDHLWFADPSLGNSTAFSFADTTDSMGNPLFYQRFFNQLSASDQSTYFPDTPPPGSLEVMYRGFGLSTATSASMQNTTDGMGNTVPVNASNGVDLLSVILHEIGHMIGINDPFPKDWAISPQHVGGLEDVSILGTFDIPGGTHLAGTEDVPGFLMSPRTGPGTRYLPSATDILVIAEELGVSNVHLTRVARISAGNWNDTNAWIGADVPNATQDAYVRQGGAVTLDVNATVRSLVVSGGGSVDVTGFQLTSAGDLRFDGGAISVGAGGVVAADAIHGDPATLTTAAGSTVEFNNFTRGASTATAATFNGNVKIGVGASLVPVTFNPDTITAWNVGQNLLIDGQRTAKLEIDNGAWSVGGNLDIVGGGEVMVDGGFRDATNNLTGGRLDVTGLVTVGGALTYRGRSASNTTYTVYGGAAFKVTTQSPPVMRLVVAGQMTFENTPQGVPVGANANSATINLGGGTGDGAPGALVTFNGISFAADAEFWNGSGIGGDSLRISNPIVIAGTGGRVVFEDSSNASTAHFRNDGVAAHGPHGSGGATHFRDESRAVSAVFDNYGSTLQSYTGAVPAPGGRTEFFDTARASNGAFNNHPGQGMGSLGAGVTIFRGNSSAADGMFYNKGGVPGAQFGGSTEFYDNATAGNATFYNERSPSLTQNSGSAGNVRFYGNSTAGNGTFRNQRGGGSVFFNDSSTAGDGHFFIENTNAGSFGGHVVFNGNSKGGTADLTIGPNCNSATIEFYGTSNAEQSQITLMNGWEGFMRVTNSASLGQANVDVGAGSGGNLIFQESATAADSTIRIRPGGGADFTGVNTTAGNATITLDGAIVANGGTGSLNFSGGKGGDATIYVNGGTVSGAAGAQISFNNGANGGTAKVIGGAAGAAGAGGGRITIDTSSNFANAQFTVGAGGSLVVNGLGGTNLGSLDVAATAAVHVQQIELRLGGVNISNTISGQITGSNGNAKITKVGAGTLTLTGANTYAGLTKVDGGTLVFNGTTPGAAEVNSGALLMGTGIIGGTITINPGGTLAPGNSPGKITVGGLTLAGGSLALELGGTLAGTQYDQVVSTGAFSLAGDLIVSLTNGFMPAAGHAFNLLDWGSLSGTFSSLSLPSLSGLSWDTSQLYTTGVLSVVSAGLPGDYNNNGVVDAADYTTYRDALGTNVILPNDSSPGFVTAADYTVWQANFGQGGPSAAAPNSSAVPEPAAVLLLLGGLLLRIRRC